MASAIDLDRGVVMKVNTARQFHVCMYVDQPGVYYNPKGIEVPVEMAREAGFDVVADAREKDRLSKRKAAVAEIDKAYEVVAEGEIVEVAGSYKIVHVGGGWHNVLDGNDEIMNPNRLRKAAAVEYMDVLVRNDEGDDGKAS